MFCCGKKGGTAPRSCCTIPARGRGGPAHGRGGPAHGLGGPADGLRGVDSVRAAQNGVDSVRTAQMNDTSAGSVGGRDHFAGRNHLGT